MKKANCTTLKKLGILFIAAFQTSFASAGDYQTGFNNDLFLSARILTAPANSPPEWMNVTGQYIFNKNIFLVHFPEIIIHQSHEKSLSHKIGKAIDQVPDYFFRYFSVEDYSSNDPEAQFRLKNKIHLYRQDPKDFDFNLSLNIGYYSADNLNIDAIRIESFLNHTFLTTIYNYKTKEIELGLSNVMINKLLFDGMKLEIQTNSYMNSGAVLLTMTM